MALAEIVVKFLDWDMDGLDYNEEWAAQDRKFSSITSFYASKESVQWLHDYISDTLKYAKENATGSRKWDGWFEEKNWIGWQKHMEELAGRIDVLLASSENRIELLSSQEYEGIRKSDNPVMG